MDVEEAWNGDWYLQGYAPEHVVTELEVSLIRADEYHLKTDRLVCEYTRKKMFNLFKDNEEAELLAEIEKRATQIKEENPYPAE